MTSMDRALMKAIESVEDKVDSISTGGSSSSSSGTLTAHTHEISDINSLQAKLTVIENKIATIQGNGDSSSGGTSTTVIAHTHAIDDIINLQKQLSTMQINITALQSNAEKHYHSISEISNLRTELDNLNNELKTLTSNTASAAYPIGSIYFTTNIDILSPRDVMPNTRWVKVKSSLSNYTAWQRCASYKGDMALLEEWFKLLYPVGLALLISGTSNATSYINSLKTNNYATLTQDETVDSESETVTVNNTKLCEGLIADKSSITTAGMLGDYNTYFYSLSLDSIWPVGAMKIFPSGESGYYKYISTNHTSYKFSLQPCFSTDSSLKGFTYVERTE